jgi:hypothetical protein
MAVGIIDIFAGPLRTVEVTKQAVKVWQDVHVQAGCA